MTLRVLDLFSGIGGFSLGLERAGMRTVAFCEIEPYPRAVLAERWPGVPIYPDVRELTGAGLAADGIGVDVICGGFPCQDISSAGRRIGIGGERSGLWGEYARLIRELRPRYVVVENVADLLYRGLGDVLGDLAEIGFDSEWHCIPAAAIGAPHIRDRVWIVAYPNSGCVRGSGADAGNGSALSAQGSEWVVCGSDSSSVLAYGDGHGASQRGPDERVGWLTFAREIARHGLERGSQWTVEPGVGRVVHGIPDRLERLRGLGNAVVPQIPEIIGRAILEAEAVCVR